MNGLNDMLTNIDDLINSLSIEETCDKMEKQRNDFLQKREQETATVKTFAPFVEDEEALEVPYRVYKDIDLQLLDTETIQKVRKSCEIMHNAGRKNFKIVKDHHIYEYVLELVNEFQRKFEYRNIPKGCLKQTDYINDDLNKSDKVQDYCDLLSDMYEEQMKLFKCKLLKYFEKITKEFLKPENIKNEEALIVAQELANKLNTLWGDNFFTCDKKEHYPDFEYCVDIYYITMHLMPDIEVNDNDSFFSPWVTKSILSKDDLHSYCQQVRQYFKEIADDIMRRFLAQINDSLYPLNDYITEFNKNILNEINTNIQAAQV